MKLTRLREVRELRGWSQSKLAEESGVSRDGISNYETGHREAWPSTAKKLADALGVEIADLVARAEEPVLAGKAKAPATGQSLSEWLKQRGYQGFLAEDTAAILERIKGMEPQLLNRHRDQLRAEYNALLEAHKEDPENVPPGAPLDEVFTRFFTATVEAATRHPDYPEQYARAVEELTGEGKSAKSDAEAG